MLARRRGDRRGRACARGCCSRCTTSSSSRSRPGEREPLEALVRAADGRRRRPDGAPRRVGRHRPQLARRRPLTRPESPRAARRPPAGSRVRSSAVGAARRTWLARLERGQQVTAQARQRRRRRAERAAAASTAVTTGEQPEDDPAHDDERQPTPGRPTGALRGPARSRPAAGASTARCRARRTARAVLAISAYCRPPTKTSASCGSSARAERCPPRPSPATRVRLAQSAPARPFVSRRHRRERDHHHELRQEQHRLGEDQAAGVQAGVVRVEDVAGDDDVDVGQREEREQGLRVVERSRAGSGGAGWRSLAPAGGSRRRRAKRQPATTGTTAPGCTPSMRVGLGGPPEDQGGADRPAAGPRRRGRSADSGHHRRSPCRMPA